MMRHPGIHRSGTRTCFEYLLQGGAGLGSLLLAGCLTAARHQPELTVPGTYANHQPCGGAEWDELILTILPSHVFTLQQVDRDQGCGHQVTLLYVGRWRASSDGRRLSLDSGPAWLRRMDVVDRRTLSFPEQPMAEHPLPASALLSSQTRLVPFREPLQLTGLTIMVNQPK